MFLNFRSFTFVLFFLSTQTWANQNTSTTEIDFTNLPNQIDLSHRDSSIKQQVGGSCTAYGLVAAIENKLNSAETKIDLSESHLLRKATYLAYGVSVDEVLARAQNRSGITSEEYWPEKRRFLWPYRGYLQAARYFVKSYKDLSVSRAQGSNSTPVEEIPVKIKEALEELTKGNPIYFGTHTTSSFSCSDTPYIKPNQPIGGGHAIAIVGYVLDSKDTEAKGGYFKIKNSWGSQCGQNGYQYVPFSHCFQENGYCAMFAITEIGDRLND